PTALAGHAQIAALYGLGLTSYEGGTHIEYYGSNAAIRELYDTINRDPRMYDIYMQVFEEWHSYGAETGVAYTDVYGPTFGHLQHLDDADTSARWQALMDYNETQEVYWETARSGTAFDHGVTLFGT